ncbi:MAG: hypothetical protein IT581_03970 [Verrucomicrobiales bacterium]|nr:hypothetical protein [Verrucomicrobiae bacterium]MCC7373789.1 hypothetical protein [Verrucomicrobiales bacterium]
MSRWLSPEKAGRRAERAAKDAEQLRCDKRRSLMLIIGVAVVSVGLVVADYFWLLHQAKQKHERRYHRGARTNAQASAEPVVGQNPTANHE